MDTSIPTLALLMFLLIVVGNSNSNIICHEKERTTLLNFRNGLTDPLSRSLSSWSVQENCCQWTGVRCDNVTGRVIELDLHYMQLRGEINHSLLELQFLSHLELASNGFYGLVPHQLGNLSRLLYLDLNGNYGLFVDDLSWISGLHSLKYLDMSGVNLSKTVNWLQEMNKLPSLSELYLSFCGLESMYPFLSYVNFTSLTVLDLSENLVKYEVPNWLSNIHGLRDLELSYNQLTGPIPASLGNLSSLTVLAISFNKLSGNLPNNLGLLSNLEVLVIEQNSITGVVSEVHFAKLSKLDSLHISRNLISFNVSPNWIPPFQVIDIEMSYCKVGLEFPAWLRTQKNVGTLFMSNSKKCRDQDDRERQQLLGEIQTIS